MKRIALTLASGAFIAVGLAAAPSANAVESATGYARCDVGYMCVFTGKNGSGAIGKFKNGDVNLAVAPGPSGLNNNIESMRNRTTGSWCFYGSTNYNTGTGSWRGYPGGGSNTVPAATNTISSLKAC